MQEFQNPELESQVLGVILTYPDLLHKAPDLNASHFSEPFYSKVFRIARDYIESSQDFSIVLLFAAFPSPEEKQILRSLLTSSVGIISIQTQVKELIKLSTLRKLHRIMLDKAQSLTIDSDVDQIISDIDAEINKDRNVYKIFKEKEVCLEIAKNLGEELPCYSTGIDVMDVAMAGGLYPKRTYCFAADQKAGKTVILATLSHNLSKQKIKHLYIAVEMGAVEIMQRNVAHDIGKNSLHFLDQKKRKEVEFKQEVADYAMNNEGAALFVDAAGIHFDKLRRLIVSTVRKYKLTGIVLDYLQIVSGAQKGENESQFQGRVAQWIADCCKKENIWCVYSAQKNREGQLRGSDGIKNAVDQLYMVFKPEEENDSGKRWMNLVASRYTKKMALGNETMPAFRIDSKGPYLVENREKVDEESYDEGITSYK